MCVKDGVYKNFKNNFCAALETALLLKSGTKAFSGCKGGMILSFLIPVLALPVTLLMVLSAHPGDLAQGSAQILTFIHILRLVISLAAYTGFIYLMAKTMDKMDNFKRFVTANNWLSLPATLAMLPFLSLYLSGAHAWADIYPMMVLITLYSYVYTAFMASHVLRIPMELAGFMAIAGMAIHQTSLGLLKWAAVSIVTVIA